nr:immunoglobulin heavy chain junction region [Macaca mulatta]
CARSRAIIVVFVSYFDFW